VFLYKNSILAAKGITSVDHIGGYSVYGYQAGVSKSAGGSLSPVQTIMVIYQVGGFGSCAPCQTATIQIMSAFIR
jgi:hypothetical protein